PAPPALSSIPTTRLEPPGLERLAMTRGEPALRRQSESILRGVGATLLSERTARTIRNGVEFADETSDTVGQGFGLWNGASVQALPVGLPKNENAFLILATKAYAKPRRVNRVVPGSQYSVSKSIEELLVDHMLQGSRSDSLLYQRPNYSGND